MLEYQSISALCAAAEEAGVSLSELVLRDQAEEMELPTEVLYQRMRENLQDNAAGDPGRVHAGDALTVGADWRRCL